MGGLWVTGGQTYLSVGHADEAFVDQLVCSGVPRLAFHDVTLCRLISQGDSGNLVGTEREGREISSCVH